MGREFWGEESQSLQEVLTVWQELPGGLGPEEPSGRRAGCTVVGDEAEEVEEGGSLGSCFAVSLK